MSWTLGDAKKHLQVEAICAPGGTSFCLKVGSAAFAEPLLAPHPLLRLPVEPTVQPTPARVVPGS